MSRLLDFTDVSLYAVTGSVQDPDVILSKTKKVLEGGVDAVQLRSRELKDLDFISLGKKMRDLCHEHNALFLVNNRPDLALAIDSDGVHLGHEDIPIEVAREILGHRKIVGASTHSVPQGLKAQKAGADYISCGPLWATPTKPEYEPVGLNLIGLYHAAIRVPFVPIGGIDKNNIDQVVAAGARCIAVVRGLFDAEDPKKAAQFFKQKISLNRKKELV